jgi:multiple sugar transport system substrate-binding protein
MLEDLPREKPYQKESLEVQDRELKHFSVLQYSPYVSFTALDAALSKELRKGIESGLSVGKLADAVNDTLNPLLRLGKELVS